MPSTPQTHNVITTPCGERSLNFQPLYELRVNKI